ncbi:MAG: HlyD family efflux transporter periplasmic adaptor subunit, partial [Pirellulaceae bacterium]|nr:HlyD family efflux transporter periplasmic adaptor subunit [Pirellulaceae bacterium]
MAITRVDLQQLALERKPESASVAHRTPYVVRYVIPGSILIGFIGLLIYASSDHFLPRREVTIVPVIVTRAEVQQGGTPLFQAAGWIEPRPTLVNVAALTEGVLEQLLVVEGQEVSAGDAVAKLIDADAQLALRQTEATRELRRAELRSMEADSKAAKRRIENPVHLKAALAEAESTLAKNETELAKIPFLIESAESQLKYANDNLSGKEAALGAVAGRLVNQARSERDTIEATFNELRQRSPRLTFEIVALRARVSALAEQLRLLIEESRQLEDATAKVEAAKAKVCESELAVELAELKLNRTKVTAPISGRVLQILAHPGTRVMGLESTAGQSSNIVVTMYDPKMLQVRADVRLEDIPLIIPGQPVLIETASLKEPLHGQVLQATSLANIQKNTLEVKVAINDPPLGIRPEMLVSATFLAPPNAVSDSKIDETDQRLLIPRQLIDDKTDGQFVWVADAQGCARKRPIATGKAGTDELIEVIRGLTPTDKIIASGRAGLADGDRILVTGEDTAIGTTKNIGSSAKTVGGFRDPQSILAVKYKENTGLSDCKNQGSLS